ncbi:triphosphoribosyl-dephospho-CoA synthase [Halobaculum sp. MBLA0147]|uniref:triphosphoribosyl-dephospho-CoA synthase n=1 Tax=Halobaculum sp. MBLA0147 TaxID=3079934 RepID=UPI0035257665
MSRDDAIRREPLDADRVRRDPAATAELALLLEVAGTPKPGNVDRHRDAADLHLEQFLAGAVGAREGLRMAAAGEPVGEAFETAVAGMSHQRGGNTQFGCLLLLVPLVAATTADRRVTRERVREVCRATTVADAAGFYRAFEHVDVAVADPPDGMEPLDVRRGADAVATLVERDLTLWELLCDSAEHDDNAREWAEGFPRTFRAAERIVDDDGPVTDRAARAFLDLLAESPDTLVATQHGADVADEVSDRAGEVAEQVAETESLEPAEAWADELVEQGINPGTTADITAAALYVALCRGVSP